MWRWIALTLAALSMAGAARAEEPPLFSERYTVTAAERAGYAPPPRNPGPLERATAIAVSRAADIARARSGLGALRNDPALARIAAAHSRDMLARRYFAHVSPDGQGLVDRIPESEAWRFQKAGENLWRGEGALNWRAGALGDHAVRNWIQSPSHRDNLLEPDYTLGGVGVAIAGDEVYVTMLYGREFEDLQEARRIADAAPPPDDPVGFARAVETAALMAINRQRVQTGLPSLRIDPTLSQLARDHSAAMRRGGLGFNAAGQGLLGAAQNRARVGSVAASLWRAEGGLDWRPERVADMALESWGGSQGSVDHLSNPVYQIAGLGAWIEGDRIYMTALYGAPRPRGHLRLLP